MKHSAKSGRLIIEEENDDFIKSYVEKMISQLTKLGICEILLHLLGSKYVQQDVFLCSLNVCNLFLE